MCGHTPGKVAGRQETVKAEMNGLTPGLDRSPPPRWMGGQGGQSLKVFGRTRSFWGLSSPKIEMGGKALKWLSRLDYPLAKTGETVNGGYVFLCIRTQKKPTIMWKGTSTFYFLLAYTN